MSILKVIIIITTFICSCALIEDSQDIPEPGIYTSLDNRDGYESRLIIIKKEKGYDITLTEYTEKEDKPTCIIKATGKKSSYGIWVEIPAYGPRLPIIIRKRNNALELSLKGPNDPKKSFRYCLSDRTPAGTYQPSTQ